MYSYSAPYVFIIIYSLFQLRVITLIL